MLELIGVDGLTQWDVGRQVKVDKDIDMVHFSNRPYGYSKNVKVTDGVADVPDMFLTSCAPLRVWAYVGDFEKGYTKIEKIYEVKPKNRPEDYIYTPEEVKTWENGYLVVMADYDGMGVTEEYIDLVPILQNLYITPETFLKDIKNVKIGDYEQ